jgi:ABC-type antimicrobial peptide transport system permease subunit
MVLAVRTRGAPLDFVKTLRAEVRQLDPYLAIGRINTVEGFAAASVAGRRFTTWLLALFAGAALALAAVGIYGITAYAIAQRTRELGIRLALGATPGRLLRSVVGRSLGWSVAAALTGLALASLMTSLLRSLLFEVTSGDWTMLAAAPLGLLLVTSIATWWPARQALRADPMRALRTE